MKNILSQPFLSLNMSIVLFLLSFTGSLFMWVLSYPYRDAENLQYGHLLGDDKTRQIAARNLVLCSIFYGILAIVMVYELILHYRQSRLQAWDPSIAMVNVHTPKPPIVKNTPELSSVKASGLSSPVPSGENSLGPGGRYRIVTDPK